MLNRLLILSISLCILVMTVIAYMTGSLQDQYLRVAKVLRDTPAEAILPKQDRYNTIFGLKEKLHIQTDGIIGEYLMANHAQNEKDWSVAAKNLAIVSEVANIPDVKNKAFLFTLGSGQFDRALSLAKDLKSQGDTASFSKLFLALNLIKNEDYTAADRALRSLQSNQLLQSLMPMITAWFLDTQTDTADQNVLISYHRALAASFKGQKDIFLKMSEELAKSENLNDQAKENLADVLLTYSEDEEAVRIATKIYNTLAIHVSFEEKLDLFQNKGDTVDLFFLPNSTHAGIARALFDFSGAIYGQGNADMAIIFGQMALYMDPDLDQAKIFIAQIKEQDENYEEAVALLQSIDAPSQSKFKAVILRQIADLREKQGYSEEAKDTLSKLAKQFNDSNAMVQLGDIERRNENFDEALGAYQAAFKMIEDQGESIPWALYYVRGIVYERLKQWPRAEKDLKKALEMQPNNPYILNYLGYSWVDLGLNLKEALKMIQKAVALEPGDGYITDSLGWAYYKLGEYEKAVPVLEKAVELKPYDPTINDHLGDAFWKVGRKQEARFQWRRALNNLDLDKVDNQKDSKKIQNKLEGGLSDLNTENDTMGAL